VISNSQDWRDVYSSVIYSNLIGAKPYFMVSMRHSRLLVYGLAKGSEETALVVQSSRLPYVVNYADYLNSQNVLAEEKITYNANLELAELADVRNFIIVDDAYGYNAISVGAFAVAKQAYVLFADENNIDEVVRFLAGRDVDELIIYGIVDRIVVDVLREYNPLIINQGDKFSDNVEIVKLFQELAPNKQVVLTNGDFIEEEVLSGNQPVVFIGRNNVPAVIENYIKSTDIGIGVLIGNDLVGTATNIRRQLGISVFVKFAQGARAPTGPVSEVEALDMFMVPRVRVAIDVISIIYNTATEMIEVTYRNLEDISAFFRGTLTITSLDGERQVVGDASPVFLDAGGLKTLSYSVERFASFNLSGRAFVIFGEAPNSLEYTLDKTLDVDFVNVLDNSKINVTRIWFDKSKGVFMIEIQNIGDVDVFVDAELIDLRIGYNLENIGMLSVGRLQPGEKRTFILRPSKELFDEDLERNKIVKVRVYYGERENALVNVFEGNFELVAVSGGTYIWIVSIIAVVGLLLFFLLLKLRVKCDNCGHRNFITRSRCKECGHKL
jgi:hypothetical protein